MFDIKRPMLEWEKALLGITLLIVIFAFFFIIQDKTKVIKNFPSVNSGIVAFGDSLIVGVGSESGSGMIGIVSGRIGETIINEGVSGNTTADGLQRINDVLRHQPKITIISLGGNDALQNVDIEKTEDNLDRIIARIQNTGSIVVLLGVRNGLFNDDFKKMYKDLADRHDVALVTDILSGLIGDSRYMADAVHPNDAGYEKIAARVAPLLIRLNQ